MTGIILSEQQQQHHKQPTLRQHEQQPADVTRKRKRKRNISIYSFVRSPDCSFFYDYFYKNCFHHRYKNPRSCCKKKSKNSTSALILPIFFLLLHFRIGFASVVATTTVVLVNTEPGQNLTSTTAATTTTIVNNNNNTSSASSRNDKNKNNIGSTITEQQAVRRQQHRLQQLQSDQPQLLPLMQQQPCSISELTCTNGKCVPLNKYCDNINDCGDSSDEPRFCTSEYQFLVLFLLSYLSNDTTVSILPILDTYVFNSTLGR